MKHTSIFVRTAFLVAVTTILAACESGEQSGADGSGDAADTVENKPALLAADDYSRIMPGWAADTSWLDFRAREQAAAIQESSVFHAFSFSDQRDRSRIGFVHEAVDDGARAYKAVHYDHGTGVAAADVNGDGHVDVYFVNQVGANELWLNRGDGTFRDITTSAGVALDKRIGSGASFADIDNDGDQDLYVTTIRGGNAMFENDGYGSQR